MNLSLMAILVIPLLITLGVAVHAWFQRPNRNAFALFTFMATTFAHQGFYLFQLTSAGLVMARFWMFAALPWSLLMGVGWFVLALHVAGYERAMHRVHYMLLSAVPIIVTLLGWSNHFHGLYGHAFHMETKGIFNLLVFEGGPIYWVNTGFLTLTIGAGLVILIQTIIRHGRRNPWQAAWISVGILILDLDNSVADANRQRFRCWPLSRKLSSGNRSTTVCQPAHSCWGVSKWKPITRSK